MEGRLEISKEFTYNFRRHQYRYAGEWGGFIAQFSPGTLEFIVKSSGTEIINVPRVKNKDDNKTKEQSKSFVHLPLCLDLNL